MRHLYFSRQPVIGAHNIWLEVVLSVSLSFVSDIIYNAHQGMFGGKVLVHLYTASHCL